MSIAKEQRRAAKQNIRDAREIITHMEKHINSKDTNAIELAVAFFHIFNHHLEHGDLQPWNVHLTQLLRKKTACLTTEE